jgi:branched-chain amino acid transport system substrate-binding protein
MRSLLRSTLIAAGGLFSIISIASDINAAEDTINIGIILPQSGQNGDYVKRYLNAPTELAAKEVNQAGGILGRQVKVIVEDSKYDPASAISALRKLADIDHVLAVFTGFTPLTLPQLPIAEEKHILVMAPSTEHPDLTKSDWAVRMTATADKAGGRIANLANTLGYKTAATLTEDNEAVRITERAFQKEFEKLGGKIVGAESFKTQDNQMRGQLTKLKAANPDVLYVVASSGRPMALVLRQVKEVGFRPKQVFTNHLVEDKEVRALGPDLLNGMIYTTLAVSPEFASRFEKEFGYPPDANAGKHYDATMLLFDAIKKAGTTDPEKVRDAIYNYGEYDGVLGKFIFSGSGEPNISPILKTVKDGEYVAYNP